MKSCPFLGTSEVHYRAQGYVVSSLNPHLSL